MAENKQVRITPGRPRERTIITPEGKFKSRLEIPYTIDDATYYVTIDKDGATPEIIAAAIKEDAKKFIGLEGKTLTI